MEEYGDYVNQFKNHGGLFWSGDTLMYADYFGKDILFRHQFKFFIWIGAGVDFSWDGHEIWDYDRAVLIDCYKWELKLGEIWSNGQGDRSHNINGDFEEFYDHEDGHPWNAFDAFFVEAKKELGDFYKFRLATKNEILEFAKKEKYGENIINKLNKLGLIEVV